MYYFNFIPNELTEIIVSYLEYDDFVSFNDSFIIDLNYSHVYNYRYGTVLKLDYNGYKKYLGVENVKKELSLEDTIEELIEIKELYLLDNKFISVPKSIGELTQLEELSFDYNKLTSLPDTIGNLIQLEKLDLSDNRLESLPESIGELSQLRILLLYGNKLTSIPEIIGNLTQLKCLFLDKNKLTSLPETKVIQPKDLWSLVI